jgi:hypothetical protein
MPAIQPRPRYPDDRAHIRVGLYLYSPGMDTLWRGRPENAGQPHQQPASGYTFYDPSARPPRVVQWSIGIQRELQQNVVVEATYVGNREVWGAATAEDQIASNSLNNSILAHYGLKINDPNTQRLLTSLIGSPQAVAAGGCFNPQTTLTLNKAAWTDAPGGTFGVSSPFYNNYRWQRQPGEALSLGRNFRFGKEGKYNFFLRAEFTNPFNRLFLSMPLTGSNQPTVPTLNANPATPPSLVGGVYNGGYGYVATIQGAGSQPRSGQIVGRFTF